MSKIKIFSLGGLNENGKNMYVVNVDGNIFVFDAGLKFDNDKNLGIDYILPNFDYLIKNKRKIRGIFLTHGHESNIGATKDIIEAMPNVPIYATRLTMEILKRDLDDAGIKKANLKQIRPHQKLEFTKIQITFYFLVETLKVNTVVIEM